MKEHKTLLTVFEQIDSIEVSPDWDKALKEKLTRSKGTPHLGNHQWLLMTILILLIANLTCFVWLDMNQEHIKQQEKMATLSKALLVSTSSSHY